MSQSLVVVSDLHVGIATALWPDRYPLIDGGIYECNKFQKHLWRCWKDCIKQVGSLPEKPWLVVNGDTVAGVRGQKVGQLITPLRSIQAAAAFEVLRPLVDKCSKVWTTEGTEFHDGLVGDSIEQLAEKLGAVQDPATTRHTWKELFLDMDGDVLNIAHHIGTTSLPNNEASVVLRDLLNEMGQLWVDYRHRAPNVNMIVRSHRHRFVHIDTAPDLNAVVTPCWGYKDAFGHRVAQATRSHIGWILVQRGLKHLTVEDFVYPQPLPYVQKG